MKESVWCLEFGLAIMRLFCFVFFFLCNFVLAVIMIPWAEYWRATTIELEVR